MSYAWTEVRDTFILVDRTWIRSSEIATVADVMDEHTAPKQWARAEVVLRDGRVISTDRKSAKQILDLLTDPGDPQ